MGAKKSIDSELGQTFLILQGSIAAGPELKARLTAVGYTEAVLNAGYALHVAAGGQLINAFAEHGQQLKSTLDLNALRDTLDRQYSLLAQISKTVFTAQPDVLATLGLQTRYATPAAVDGQSPPDPKPVQPSQAQAEVIGRARRLYAGIIAQPDWVAQLAPVGYTLVRLQKELDDVTALENADVEQEREKGEVRGAKAKQTAALVELRAWVRRFTGIVIPALSDRPDLLSQLGLKPKGRPRKA
jgi:hypothetical protein